MARRHRFVVTVASWAVALLHVLAVAASLPVHAQDVAPPAAPSAPGASTTPTVPPTGPQWHAATFGDSTPRLWNVVASHGGFAAIGTGRSDDPSLEVRGGSAVWLSTDGSAWTEVPEPFGTWFDTQPPTLVAYQEGLMAVAADGLRLAVWRSPDGASWRRVPDQQAFGPSRVPRDRGYFLVISGVVSGRGRVVVNGGFGALGDRRGYARVFSSRDGEHWSSATPVLPQSGGVTLPVVGHREFLGLEGAHDPDPDCEADQWSVVRSLDGVHWDDAGDDPLCLIVSGLAYDAVAGRLLATGLTGVDRVPVVLERDRHRWRERYRGPAAIDGVPLQWSGGVIAADTHGHVVVAGDVDTHTGPDTTVAHRWTLTTGAEAPWDLSIGWPDMVDQVDVRGVAVADGRAVMVSAYGRSPALWLDLVASGPTPSPGALDLWSPVDPAAIPFEYFCGDDRLRFTASDLAAPPGQEAAPGPIGDALRRLGTRLDPPTGWRLAAVGDTGALVVNVVDDRRRADHSLYTFYLVRDGEGWRWDGREGDCRPWARSDDPLAVGGRWRLDPAFPTPTRSSRVLHALVTYPGCPQAVKLRGRPRVVTTEEAVIVVVPVAAVFNSDACSPGEPSSVTIRLPEALDARTLYDAGTLPIGEVRVRR